MRIPTRIGPVRVDPGPITDSGARSAWHRLEGPGEPSDFSAGASFEPDYRGEPTLRLLPPAATGREAAQPRETGAEPMSDSGTPEWTVDAPQWVAGGRFGQHRRDKRGNVHWDELPAPEIDAGRGQYLAAKWLRSAGSQGLESLRDVLSELTRRNGGST